MRRTIVKWLLAVPDNGQKGSALSGDVRRETTVIVSSDAVASSMRGPSLAATAESTERAKDGWIAALLFVVSLAYLCVFRRYSTIEPDEGIILQGAQRILNGEMPYRDFFTFLTPGSFYLQALLSKIFGDSFLVARTALAVSGGLSSVFAYLLARRVCDRRIALLASGLAMATALPYRFLVLHNWDSTLLSLIAVYAAIRLLESTEWKWAFALGLLCSTTTLFEQSKGLGLSLGLLVGSLVLRWSRPQRRFSRRLVLAVAVGFILPLLATVAYFAWRHALPQMLADLLWPFYHYSAANRVVYGYQNWSDADRHLLFGTGSFVIRLLKSFVISPCFAVPLLPLLCVAFFFYWICPSQSVKRDESRRPYYLVITAALSGLLVSVVMVRADIIHFMYLLPLLSIPLAWLLDGRDVPGILFKKAHIAICIYVVLAFATFALPLLSRAVTSNDKLSTRRGLIDTPADDTVLPYVQSHVSPGAKLLVYPYLPLYNYLTRTVSPTRYDYFQPGMNTPEQSAEIQTELGRAQTEFVLLESSFAQKIPNAWPNTPIAAIANDPVGDYIVKNYRVCQILQSPSRWRFLFMVRDPSKCGK